MSRVIYAEELIEGESGRVASVLTDAIARSFSAGDNVAIKMHMGEGNNSTALRPEYARAVASAVKSIGARPFLFDSPVAYRSRRGSPEGYLALARERGFTPEFLGCPVRVSDESIAIRGSRMEYHLCRALVEADGVCVLTHVKGHPCTGFGGAIKNVGMGAVSKETKGNIHEGGKPVYTSGCTECFKCVEMCPTGNIRLEGGHPSFNANYCAGCSNCTLACEVGAIRPRVDTFDRLIAEATALSLSRFGKQLFINSLVNITELCDCAPNSGRIVCDNLGYIIAWDIGSVEKATFDRIKEHTGKDLFLEIHHKSPLEHIKHTQAFLASGGERTLARDD